MEAYPAIGIGTGSPVFEIAFYMDPKSRELRPDLMMPARMQVNLDKVVMIR